MLEEFAKLNPEITDETHMLSWFRDQVLHPHETQHSYDEIQKLLLEEDFVVQRTSINNFKPITSHENMVKREQKLEVTSTTALHKKRQYFPGFFVVWAKRR